MRVLMVNSVFPNHTNPYFGVFSLERLRCLKNLAEVKVIAPVPYFPKCKLLSNFDKWHTFSQIQRHEIIEDIDIYHPQRLVLPKIGSFTSGYFYYLTLMNEMKRIYARFPFDVIDAHFLWPDGYAALKAGKKLNIPVCITAHGTDVHVMPKVRFIRPFIEKTVKGAHRIITVSKSLAKIVMTLGGEEQKVKVIHNGVDLSKFKRMDQESSRKDLGLPLKDRIIVSIGSLMPVKGHEFLIDAINIMVNNENRTDVKLIIIGSGELETSLNNQVRQHGLEKHISLVGQKPHEELYHWLSASNLFCLTSSREGWPTVFFESWACGIPVIATDVYGNSEAIKNDRYGLLVKDQNPVTIAEVINKALNMTWNHEDMIKYASENTWDKMTRLMYKELEEISLKEKTLKSTL